MNKQLIILLAVCLISVHAFVKRDAEVAKNTLMEDLSKYMDEMSNKMKEQLNPDNIKKELNSFVDKMTELANSIKPSAEAPK